MLEYWSWNHLKWYCRFRLFVRLNRLIECHSTSEACVSPKIFLSCPVSSKASRSWFINLWNFTLVPYLTECIREGVQLFGKRSSWEDPVRYIQESWPWTTETTVDDFESLSRIQAQDLGLDAEISCHNRGDIINPKSLAEMNGPRKNGDPLYSMLVHLQEAAANNSAPKQEN